MSTHIPEEIAAEIRAAHLSAKARRSRLRVVAGGRSWPVLRRWDCGFTVAFPEVPPLRGLVELFEGQRHIETCLIVASAEGDGAMDYEFKRSTPVRDSAPLDFPRDDNAPAGLLPND